MRLSEQTVDICQWLFNLVFVPLLSEFCNVSLSDHSSPLLSVFRGRGVDDACLLLNAISQKFMFSSGVK